MHTRTHHQLFTYTRTNTLGFCKYCNGLVWMHYAEQFFACFCFTLLCVYFIVCAARWTGTERLTERTARRACDSFSKNPGPHMKLKVIGVVRVCVWQVCRACACAHEMYILLVRTRLYAKHMCFLRLLCNQMVYIVSMVWVHIVSLWFPAVWPV